MMMIGDHRSQLRVIGDHRSLWASSTKANSKSPRANAKRKHKKQDDDDDDDGDDGDDDAAASAVDSDG